VSAKPLADRDVILAVLSRFTRLTAKEICLVSGLGDCSQRLVEMARAGELDRSKDDSQESARDEWRYQLPDAMSRSDRRKQGLFPPYVPTPERVAQGRALWRAVGE
jgi:hypothetical protein